MSQRKLKNKDIDLLVVYKKKKEPSKYAELMKYLAFPVIAGLILLITFAVLTFQNYRLQSNIDETTQKISDLNYKIQNDPNLEKANSLQGLLANTEKYKKLYENIMSYPRIMQSTFDQILIASGLNVEVTALSYEKDSQAITLVVESDKANDTEAFIRALKNTKEFGNVYYSGYTQIEKEERKTTTANTTPTDTENSNVDDLQALIDALNKQNQNQTTESVKVKVYTATVVCTLK